MMGLAPKRHLLLLIFCYAFAACHSRLEIPRLKLPGFLFLKRETFSCGDRYFSVDIYLHEKTGLEFVLVPGGTYDLGKSAGEETKELFNAGHRRVVIVKSFLICRTEATQVAWDRIGGTDNRNLRGPDLPINCVSWIDVTDWCKKAGLRLPTEAEWEYAAQAGAKSLYTFGNDKGVLGDYAWYSGNSGGNFHPVGQKLPNAYGLFDVHGNLAEWCQENSGALDYRGPLGFFPYKVTRGGNYKDIPWSCETAFPSGFSGQRQASFIGFRPACSIP